MRNLIAGLVLGALVGLLVGLSASDVVGAVVGALVAILASFFGLKDGSEPKSAASIRILGFSSGAIVCLVIAVFLRANNSFAPTLEARNAAWQKAGFPQEQAAELVAFERLGVLRGKWRVPEDAIPAAQERMKQMSSALFATEAAASCDVLLGRDYPDAGAFEDAFRAEGGMWQEFASAVPVEMPEMDKKAVFAAARELVCAKGDR